MEHPLTSFRFFNGTAAPQGVFDNTFGCHALNAKGQCDNPIPQTITLAYRSNETFLGRPTINEQVIRSMALAINNVSDTYHMGLHVAAEALPVYQMFQQGYAGNLYAWEVHYAAFTPFVGDHLGPPFSLFSPTQDFCNIALPSCINPSINGWNSTQTNLLYSEFLSAIAKNNASATVALANQMMELANKNLNFIWTVYPEFIVAVTSNVQGFYFNPSTFGMYFASLAPSTPAQATLGGGLFGNISFLASIIIAGALVASVGTFVAIKRRGHPGLLTQERRLAAIMFTDIVGFTALTQDNERLAMELLAEHNRLLRPMFPKFGGREVKSIGDSFLVQFSSALQAVQCAVAIQELLQSRSAELPKEKALRLRVGVHVGDVVASGSDILGDAVNIASRIEPLAEPGGVCISEQVYDQVRNKIELPLVKLDDAPLKNVSLPIDVYRIVMPWSEDGARDGS